MFNKTNLSAGIYFSHYECFGHIAHVTAMGEVFKKKFPKGNIFFIQAGIKQPKARLNEMGRVYSLPGTFVDRRNFKEPVSSANINIEMRSRMVEEIIFRERPDVFITEFFPLSREECRYELIRPLIRARAQGAKVWAIAGYPIITGKDDGWRDKILDLYEHIIILAPLFEKRFFDSLIPAHDKKRAADFFKRHHKKIKFAGYLLPSQAIVSDDKSGFIRPPVPKGACRVSVLRGGGAYYPKIVAEAIRGSDLLGKDFYLTVIAGPSTTDREWSFFNMLVKKKRTNNLTLLRAVADYERWIKESDICVSVASYNTAVMLLRQRKRSVLIPFEGYDGSAMSFYEQPARAAMLKEIMGAGILPFQGLTAQTLTAAIRTAAARRKISARIPPEWFAGGDVLGKKMKGLFGP